MTSALDFIGAVTPSQASRDRAAAAGQRLLAKGQRIAKRAPNLAATVAKAAQKALRAGGKATKATVAPPAKTATQPTAQPRAPSPQQRKPAPPVLSRPGRTVPTRAPTAVPARAMSKRTKVGEDEEVYADEGAVDVFAQIATAAEKVTDFMYRVQELVDQLPADAPIRQNGLGTISQLENWFIKPIEDAIQGDKPALEKARNIDDVIQFILDQEGNPNLPWPWEWISRAQAYLRLHPPAAAPAAPDAASPAPTTEGTAAPTPSAPVPGVARVVVAPKSIGMGVGATQGFVATALDANGSAVSPPPAVAWSASGGTVDQTGNFTAQQPGRYTVTAAVGPVTGSAVALVQASFVAPGGMSAPTGGGSGGGGGSSAAPMPWYPQDDYQQPEYEPQYAEEYTQDEYAEEGGEYAPEDEIGAAIAELGRGGFGGGRGGGHHGGGGRGGGGHRHGHPHIGPSVVYAYPWWQFSDDDLDPEELAERVAAKLKEKSAVGLDFIGAGPDVTQFNRQARDERKKTIQGLRDQDRAQLRQWAAAQRDKVKTRYEATSWLSRNLPVLSLKYKGAEQLLDFATQQIWNGDQKPGDEGKSHYILALLHGTDAAGELADAEGTSVTEDLVEMMGIGMKEVGQKTAGAALELAKKAGEGAAEGLGVPAWALWGGLALAGLGTVGAVLRLR